MPLAGLTEVALRSGDFVQAQTWVEPMLTHLLVHRLNRPDEEIYVYMACYQVLRAAANLRAAHLLRLAHAQLLERVAAFVAGEQRQLFWSAPPHREVLLEMM